MTISNRFSPMRLYLFTAITLVVAFTTGHAQGIAQNDLILVKYHKIYSEKIGEDREILVSVPEEYEKSGKKYPVLYMMDGEFNATPGLIGSIRYLEFLGQIPEFIVVGIKNTNRDKDVYPVEVTYGDGTKAGGRANQYLSFISDELIPFINKTYRTEDYKILFGTSNTGFTTVYAMFSNPGAFNAYIAASATLSIPVFTAGRDSLVKNWRGGEKFLYLVMGEHDFPTIIRLNGALKEVIDINKPAGLTCRLNVLEGEGHVPASSIFAGLKCLFRDWKYAGEITDKENPEVKQHYSEQKRKYGFSEDFPVR
ncbi:MAG: alpha/beta hydrolase-fold protein [Bacteroidales bacterium]